MFHEICERWQDVLECLGIFRKTAAAGYLIHPVSILEHPPVDLPTTRWFNPDHDRSGECYYEKII